MRRTLMVAGLVAALGVPSIAEARDACQQRAHDRKVAGTAIGAVGGALVGGAIGDTPGAVVGGVGGAVVGNQLARTNCDRPVTYRSGAARAPSRAHRTADNAAARCYAENRRYYDERGRAVYAPVQVCR